MSPKTLTGAELDLNDAPAREAELFLVDGNNLAYRAFFALPAQLATTEGFLGTWIGSTAGMVAADALAIAICHIHHAQTLAAQQLPARRKS